MIRTENILKERRWDICEVELWTNDSNEYVLDLCTIVTLFNSHHRRDSVRFNGNVLHLSICEVGRIQFLNQHCCFTRHCDLSLRFLFLLTSFHFIFTISIFFSALRFWIDKRFCCEFPFDSEINVIVIQFSVFAC